MSTATGDGENDDVGWAGLRVGWATMLLAAASKWDAGKSGMNRDGLWDDAAWSTAMIGGGQSRDADGRGGRGGAESKVDWTLTMPTAMVSTVELNWARVEHGFDGSDGNGAGAVLQR